MKAVIANSNVQGSLEIGEVTEPVASFNEAVISVTAFSLNRGELRRAEAMPVGTQIGWDITGIVEKAADDGSGPAKGQRVVGFSRRMQGWAERVTLPTTDFAVIPDDVSDADAATLPVAGLTALYTLERCERLLGNKVLITGASGGVGYFACQLASMMGADVVALLRRPDFEGLVSGLGVADVVVSADGSGVEDHGKFRAIIDGAGGPVLSALLSQLDEHGRAILYGVSAGPEATFKVRDLMVTAGGRIEGFFLFRQTDVEPGARGLARLLRLVSDKRLKTHISVTGSWQKIGETATQLIGREFAGKAVLTL